MAKTTQIETTDLYVKRLVTFTFAVSGGVQVETQQASASLITSLDKTIDLTITSTANADVQITLKGGNVEDYTKMGDLLDGNGDPIIITQIDPADSYQAFLESIFLGLGFDPLSATTGDVIVVIKL